jgi:hypothetical protein
MAAGQVQTIGASPKPVWAYTLSDNTVAEVVASVLARDSNGNSATYKRRASVKRQQGGLATLIQGVDVIGVDKADIAAWIDPMNPIVEIDVAGNDVRLRVKGVANTTINWFADIEVTLFKT